MGPGEVLLSAEAPPPESPPPPPQPARSTTAAIAASAVMSLFLLPTSTPYCASNRPPSGRTSERMNPAVSRRVRRPPAGMTRPPGLPPPRRRGSHPFSLEYLDSNRNEHARSAPSPASSSSHNVTRAQQRGERSTYAAD